MAAVGGPARRGPDRDAAAWRVDRHRREGVGAVRGLAGDCGHYLGRVVGVPVGDGKPVAFTVPTSREGGIWTPPGPTVLDGDLLVVVGNGASTDGSYDHSDSVLRLHGTSIVDSFSPTTWASDNAADLDLGSQGPTLVQGRWVFQAGKSGTAYVLAADHLGGIGGRSHKRSCASHSGARPCAAMWCTCRAPTGCAPSGSAR